MAVLRSLLFNVFFFAWTLAIVVMGLPFLLLPHRFTYRLGAFWVRVTLAVLGGLVGLRHRVVGLEHRLPGAAIYAVKHQSAWDTLVFALLLDEPAYVLKRELTYLPLFGWMLLRAGMIPVDRAGRASALRRMIGQAKQRTAAGRPLLIYPEGTRTAPGEHRPYQPGVAALYGQLDLPVVPVALNSGLFWGRRQFVIPAGDPARTAAPGLHGRAGEAPRRRLRAACRGGLKAVLF